MQNQLRVALTLANVDAWAGIVGAGIGAFATLSGTSLKAFLDERRARIEDKRAEREGHGRARGMARLVASELKSAHARIRSLTLQQLIDSEFQFSTAAWDRYGPDVCAEFDWEVVDLVQKAYNVLDVFVHGTTGTGRRPAVSGSEYEEMLENLATVPQEERESILELGYTATKARDGAYSALAHGYNALLPYLDTSERLESRAPASSSLDGGGPDS